MTTSKKLTDEEIERLLAIDKKLKNTYKKQNERKKERCDIVTLAVPKGTKEIWQFCADEAGKSLTRFIADIVNEHIDN